MWATTTTFHLSYEDLQVPLSLIWSSHDRYRPWLRDSSGGRNSVSNSIRKRILLVSEYISIHRPKQEKLLFCSINFKWRHLLEMLHLFPLHWQLLTTQMFRLWFRVSFIDASIWSLCCKRAVCLVYLFCVRSFSLCCSHSRIIEVIGCTSRFNVSSLKKCRIKLCYCLTDL